MVHGLKGTYSRSRIGIISTNHLGRLINKENKSSKYRFTNYDEVFYREIYHLNTVKYLKENIDSSLFNHREISDKMAKRFVVAYLLEYVNVIIDFIILGYLVPLGKRFLWINLYTKKIKINDKQKGVFTKNYLRIETIPSKGLYNKKSYKQEVNLMSFTKLRLTGIRRENEYIKSYIKYINK
jgi:hypothetical protein